MKGENTLVEGQAVRHTEFGDGRVVSVLGRSVVVTFMGDEFDVDIDELELRAQDVPRVDVGPGSASPSAAKVAFRKSYEAMVLGVVPPNPNELIRMTIGGQARERDVRRWLRSARNEGLCKVVFGYYGSGKSHYLNFVRCVALTEGWVVSFLELDPAAADPARPNLVYNQIVQRLQFPPQAGATESEGVAGFLAEVRRHWRSKNLRGSARLRESQWLRPALEALMIYPDPASEDYQIVSQYIAGAPNTVTTLRTLARANGLAVEMQAMRSSGETAVAYAHNLAVIDALCRKMGYKGLCVIVDEAEHFRNFSTRRRERASNFLDVLGRAAHMPNPTLPGPEINELDRQLAGVILNDGPHFALFVGLTHAGDFREGAASAHESCVLLHDEADRIDLTVPVAKEYRDWAADFLARFANHYREEMAAILDPTDRQAIVQQLFEGFGGTEGPPGSSLRHWVKLATLAPSVLFADPALGVDDLREILRSAINPSSLPWEK